MPSDKLRGAVCRGQVDSLSMPFAGGVFGIITVIGHGYAGVAGAVLGGIVGLVAAVVVFRLQRSREVSADAR